MHWRPLSPDVDSVHRLQLPPELGAQEDRLRLVKLPPHLDIVDNVDKSYPRPCPPTSRSVLCEHCPRWHSVYPLPRGRVGCGPAWPRPCPPPVSRSRRRTVRSGVIMTTSPLVTSHRHQTRRHWQQGTAGDAGSSSRSGAGKHDVGPRRRRGGTRWNQRPGYTATAHQATWDYALLMFMSFIYVYIYKHSPQKFNTFSLNQLILFQYFQLLNLPSFVLQLCLTRECLSVMKGDVYWKLMPFARFSTSLSFLCLL